MSYSSNMELYINNIGKATKNAIFPLYFYLWLERRKYNLIGNDFKKIGKREPYFTLVSKMWTFYVQIDKKLCIIYVEHVQKCSTCTKIYK
jgi:hypothetical protein